MKLIDTHCHITDDRYEDKDAVVRAFFGAGGKVLVNGGYDVASSEEGAVLAEKYPGFYFTVGIHPDNAENALVPENGEKLKTLVAHAKCLAIGEIGLDYHYEPFDAKTQQKAFLLQIFLAKETGLPFVVHARDATEDTVRILRFEKPKELQGVMHCYAGSKETAKILLDAGMYFSFSGTLTFKNAANLRDVAAYLPKDRILTETDSPYLAPEPFRGQENCPSHVSEVLKKLAEVRGEEIEEVADAVFGNACRIFPKLDEKLWKV